MSAVLPPGQLVVGMQLPVQSQSTIYAEAWEASAGAEVRRVAQAADGAGFWYVAVCDHVAVPRPAGETMGTEWWDTVATLGWLAGITSRVRLVSHITVLAYRHPLVTAKAWSTLDVVSDGRAVMGVGTGHVAGELALLGVDFARRGALLDEAIDAVRACFAEEYPSFAGQEWRFADAGQRPRPVQPGGPAIWVGGSSPPARRRAAERGDGWLPQGPVTAEDVAGIRAHRRACRGDDRIDLGALAGRVYVGNPTWDVGPAPCALWPAREAGPRAGQVRRPRRRPGAGPAPVAVV